MAAGVVIEVVNFVGPTAISRLRGFHRLAAAGVWLVMLAMVVLAAAGFVSTNIGDSIAARAVAIDHAHAANDQRTQAITIAQLAVKTDQGARDAECALRGPRCRLWEQNLSAALAELQQAIEMPLATAPSLASADPLATAAAEFGFPADRRDKAEPGAWAELEANWAALTLPRGTSALDKLTHVPGLAGEIVEWIVSGARRPNRMMALGAALAIVGTLIGRRIKGPTGSSTHLYIVILAPTGYGKDWPLHCGEALMVAIGEAGLLGPHELASSTGVWNWLKRNPLTLCFVDELGDELSLLKTQAGNEFVSKVVGTLKKCYNAWVTVRTAEKAQTQSETIYWPMPSIVGAATPERFFKTLDPGDLESGFANRFMILPFEGSRRPPEKEPEPGAAVPPKALIAKLKKLPRQRLLGPAILNQPPGTPSLPELEEVGWGAGASDAYFAFSRKMDGLEQVSRQQYELGMRACEIAVRLATIVAVGRGSRMVDREDIEWAIQLAECSFGAAVGGFDRYMNQYFAFPELCAKVLEAFVAAGGFYSKRDIHRDFRRSKKYGKELDAVLQALVAEDRIKAGKFRNGERGAEAVGWFLLGEDGVEAEQ